MAGEVLGGEAACGWYAPDLEEVDLLVAMGVLTMADACACGGHLEVSALHDLDIAHRITTM